MLRLRSARPFDFAQGERLNAWMLRRMIARTVAALLSRTYNRYLLASIVALGCDMVLFLGLHRGGMPSVAAMALGYMAGIVVHWLVSTRFVFEDRIADGGGDRVRAKGLFILTALMGLAITMAIGALADSLGLDARIAKLVAVAISFQATYVARRVAIFRM